jgi:two-component system copper resistance phosphate regulon response regulator CusR
MRLLVIEDEVKLAEYLRKGLTEEGYVVDMAHNGVDGLHLAMEGHYDLLVLDGMLPGIDGLGLLAALRQSKQTPVLMLTARIRVEDRVRGLQGGADDYLVKPFAFSELLARIQVLLRRARPVREACCAARPPEPVAGSTSPPRNSPSWLCCCVARARYCLAPRLRSRCGTSTSTAPPT